MRGASGRPVSTLVLFLFFSLSLIALVGGTLGESAEDGSTTRVDESQIRAIRKTIHRLESRLETIRRQAEDLRKQQQELDVKIKLAEARVEEIRLILTRSRDEIVRIKEETSRLSEELLKRRKVLEVNVQLAALMGKPGPLQLMWDALRGGHLEEATSLVLTLTRGQVALVREYGKLRDERASRLADLSRILERAGEEARELQNRRSKLDALRQESQSKLAKLEREQKHTGGEIEELRQREAAFERLFERVSRTRRLTGKENIYSYRGALPWPVKGAVVRGFGRHYLAKYATYTLCNGLRMRVKTGEEVHSIFSGVVAFARFFKGYGNMVVVDHGHEVYSMIAGLSSIHVRLNQKVSIGTRLGLAGQPKDDGNIYVEIRAKGKAEDPRRWMQLQQGR